MSEPTAPNAAQIDYWNATAGRTWAQFQETLDRQIEPLGREAMLALEPRPGERIVDIGCGCGQTSLGLAREVGPSGAVVGVDISEPMLEVARARPVPDTAATPVFLQADAQTTDFGPDSFDAAFSRFGVMFFSDPPAAFTNLRKALKPGGRLTFVCWRSPAENTWMRIPVEAARDLLPPMTPPDPSAPGPYAFADPERVRAILGAAGFNAIRIRAFDTDVGGLPPDETVAMSMRVGPLAAAIREAPERTEAIAGRVRKAVTPFQTPNGVLMPAAVWIVEATR